MGHEGDANVVTALSLWCRGNTQVSSLSRNSFGDSAGGLSGSTNVMFIVNCTGSAVHVIEDIAPNAVQGGHTLRWSMTAGSRLRDLVFSRV